MNTRLQKLLADFGYASRRTVEKWIVTGRIQLNGKTAQLGDRADLTKDKLTLDGKSISADSQKNETQLILYHKPVGEICSRSDPQYRPTIFEQLPHLKKGRWINVGRLDINSSGLLLLTNDGDLANRLMHPKHLIEREYLARVLGKLTTQQCEQLKKGMRLEDGMAKFKAVGTSRGLPLPDEKGEGANHWYSVTIMEGRNRLVRRLFESQGLQVNRLIRIRFGDIMLPRDLKPGKFRFCSAAKLFH